MNFYRIFAITAHIILLEGASSFVTSSTRWNMPLMQQESLPTRTFLLEDASKSSFQTSLQSSTMLESESLVNTEETSKNAVANSAAKRSWEEDGFVFGLEGSGLERPKGRVANVVVEGDSLETKPYQVAIVSVTMAAHALFATQSFMGMLEQHHGNWIMTGLHAFILLVSSWILADFGSGVLHWSVDNYGNGRTPIMGSIIAAFQGHHSAPWTITERGFCNNVYKLCLPFGIVPMLIINAISGPATTFFFTVFCVLEILSQEFHKWSHQLKSQTPAFANWLQASGLTIARTPHALHHTAPFEGNYCIISGACNPFLDESGFFRRLEHIVYKINGVESNAWKLDPELRDRTLAGDYRPPRGARVS